MSEQEGVATYKQKLDVLKEQEELIADELEQEAAIQASKQAKEDDEALQKELAPQDQGVNVAESQDSMSRIEKEDKEGELSETELKKLAEALKTMSKDSALADVKETLEELKEGRQDFIEVSSI